jgi:hypothetical protein
MTSMLRATPGCRRIRPARSSVSTIWWTDGGLTEVPLQVRFGRGSAEDARIGIDEGQILTLLWREAWYSGRGRHRQLVDRALRGAGDSRSSSSSVRRWRSPSREARRRSIEACA